MEKWIQILVAGEYPQGNVTAEDLQLIAQYYDPSLQQAPFIPEHRKFDSNGELCNNMAALGWVKACRYNAADLSLEILPDDSDPDLQYVYDGSKFKYASAEIETVQIGTQKIPYLSAVCVTNFPASKIQRIKLTGKEDIRVYTQKLNIKKDIKMDLKKLCKILKIDENSTIEQAEAAITKLTETAGASAQLSEILKLVKAPEAKKEDATDPVQKSILALTETIQLVLGKFSSIDEKSADEAFESGVKEGKFLPGQKEALIGTKEKPGAYYKNPEGLKAFAATQPKLVVDTKTTALPKGADNQPLKYTDLMKDPVAFQKLQKESPETFNQLRSEWLSDPNKVEKKEVK